MFGPQALAGDAKPSATGAQLPAVETEQARRVVGSWPRFHGPKGDNISTETGLLKKWPEQGPRLLWTAKEIGQGFAGVTIADGRIYTAGDAGDELIIFALDMDGQVQWRVHSGSAWRETGPAGARGTPTIDGDRLYQENAHDDLVCLDAKTGRKIWDVNLASRFQGKKDGFGRAKSLLIDGDRVICCPGGATAMAALDKKTGQTFWKSPSAGEPAGYASPILAEYQGLRMVFTMASKSLICVNANSGELLWRFEHYTPRYVANCVTPIYDNGHVFVSGGYGLGSALLKIDVKDGRSTAEPVWRSEDLDNRHGGVILVDGCLYGSAHFKNGAKWICLDWKTGRKLYAEKGVGEGSLTCADGMLYTMSEHGKIGLVRPTPAGYQLVSQFKLPAGGEGPAWAHPVVCDGRLYLRHDDRLYAYDVRAMPILSRPQRAPYRF
jgi:outer membrane protein assembly factor BamB